MTHDRTGNGRLSHVRINEAGKDLALVLHGGFDVDYSVVQPLGEVEDVIIWSVQQVGDRTYFGYCSYTHSAAGEGGGWYRALFCGRENAQCFERETARLASC